MSSRPESSSLRVGQGSGQGGGKRERRLYLTALLGSDGSMRMRVAFCLVAGFIHFVFALAYIDAARQGRMAVWATQFMVATNLIGMLAFYPVVRLQLASRLADRGLVLTQMMCAILSAAAGYVLAPSLRPMLLQAFCVAQLFGLFSLRTPQLLLMGATSLALLTLELAAGAFGWMPQFDLALQGPPLLTTILVMVPLIRITAQQSRKSGRLREQRQELERITAQLDEINSRDALTRLLNRRRMQAMLDEEHARLQNGGRGYAVVLLDLDHFKRINDTQGHAGGDAVLVRFAELARQSLRTTDSIARWGGEEFLLLLGETDDGSNLCTGLKRLREHMRADTVLREAASAPVTFSAGVAAAIKEESVEQMLRRADEALYAAKAAGRDRITVAGPASDACDSDMMAEAA